MSHCGQDASLKGAKLTNFLGKARDGLYEPVLADSEREAVADLLQYLENVSTPTVHHISPLSVLTVFSDSAVKPISSPANLFVPSAPLSSQTTSICNEVLV